jgi:hypothetical protein
MTARRAWAKRPRAAAWRGSGPGEYLGEYLSRRALIVQPPAPSGPQTGSWETERREKW